MRKMGCVSPARMIVSMNTTSNLLVVPGTANTCTQYDDLYSASLTIFTRYHMIVSVVPLSNAGYTTENILLIFIDGRSKLHHMRENWQHTSSKVAVCLNNDQNMGRINSLKMYAPILTVL